MSKERLRISDTFILIGSIGLATATIPKLYKIINDPSAIREKSIYYLISRLVFTFTILTGLTMIPHKSFGEDILFWLTLWYTCYHIILLAYYVIQNRKK